MDFIANNLIWVATAILSGGMLFWPMLRGGLGGASVSPLEATLLVNREDAIILDVREPDEFARGHIPNARHIPLKSLDQRLSELEKFKDRPVIVNCQSGSRSISACATLRKKGFNKVFNLNGGMGSWQEAGQLVTTK